MTHFVGLDISQKTMAICVVDNSGCRLWRGQCPSNPEQIEVVCLDARHARAGSTLKTGAFFKTSRVSIEILIDIAPGQEDPFVDDWASIGLWRRHLVQRTGSRDDNLCRAI